MRPDDGGNAEHLDFNLYSKKLGLNMTWLFPVYQPREHGGLLVGTTKTGGL